MAFKMKGSAFKLGGIQGTSGHVSALKQGAISQEEIQRQQEEHFRKIEERRKRGLPDEDINRGTGLDTRTPEQIKADQEKENLKIARENRAKGMVQLPDGTWVGTGGISRKDKYRQTKDEEFGPLPMKSPIQHALDADHLREMEHDKDGNHLGAYDREGGAERISSAVRKAKMKPPLKQGGNMTTCPWPGCGEAIREAKLQQHLEDHMDAMNDSEFEEDINIEEENQGGGGGGGTTTTDVRGPQ